MKNPWIVIGVLTIVLFGGAIWYSNVVAKENNVGVEPITHVKRPQVATVADGDRALRVATLTEYSDFQCPACASFQPVLNEVLATYEGYLEFEFKHFPLPMHPNALPAAVAAEAAGQQGKFFEYHDKLYGAQSEWSGSLAPNAIFIRYAEELGLDTDLFKKHLNSSVLKDKVKADFQTGSQLTDENGDPLITGTPTFLLNGTKMEFSTFDEFVAQIILAIDPTAASGTSPVSNASEVKFGL